MNAIVTASGVSLELPSGRILFSNLNFTIHPKLTALVGPNGVGKTCLAQLLVGEIEPSTGSIRRNVPVTLFHQRQEPPPITIEEFLTEDYSWLTLGEKLLDGIDRQKLCTHLSGGQWMRVRLAHSLGNQFLILDEPTNDLDREGREALMHYLQRREGGALLISHDRQCLQLCKDILELSNRGLSKFGDGWDRYENAKNNERKNLSMALDSAKRDRDQAQADRIEQMTRQEKRNRRGAETAERGGIPKILLGARKRRAQVTTGSIDALTLAHANSAVRNAYEAFDEMKIDPIMYANLTGMPIPNQKLIAEARGFNIKFKDWLYPNDLNFTWRGNLRLALKGGNGAGKSTLIKAILGTSFETLVKICRVNLKILYVDQRCSILDERKNIFENIRDVSRLDENEIRNGLAKFLFTKDSVFQKVSSLSGGERLRATLARGLLSAEKPEILILDEPTNNLDLLNIQFLENFIREFQGALIVVSHDEVFLKNANVTEVFDFSLRDD